MDSDNKSTLSGLVGHSISTFTIFCSDDQSESNNYLSSSSSFNHCDTNTSNKLSNGNSTSSKSSSSSIKSINNNGLESNSNYHFNINKENHFNHNDNNDVAYNRLVSNVHIDEVRSLLYGSWDPEQSEQMWNDINGCESEDNLVITNTQIVREEDLIKYKKCLDVKLFTNHLNDFVNYDVNNDNETNSELESKFYFNNKYVLLFGGVNLNEENFTETFTNLFTLINGNYKLAFSNSLYYSEAQSFKSSWEQLENKNTPEPRAFHSSCVLYSNVQTPILAVSGGLGTNKTLLETDLYLLNLIKTNLEWKVFRASGPNPPKRYGHTMSQVGRYILLFGGCDGVKLHNDVWALNVNDGSYQIPGELSGNTWYNVNLDGTGPSPRAFHSCCKVGISSKSPMVVYGGLNQVETVRNRLYALHFVNEDKMKWSVLPVYVKCPSEMRAFHSMTFVDNKFVITGGEDMKNEYNTNMKSLVYSLENKSFQYIEDTVSMAGHRSWSAFGMIYHWGGLSKNSGKVTFDESISISNPLTYSDDSNIEEIYYKYIRFASMNTQYESSKTDSENKVVDQEYSKCNNNMGSNTNEMDLDKVEELKQKREIVDVNESKVDSSMSLLERSSQAVSDNNKNKENKYNRDETNCDNKMKLVSNEVESNLIDNQQHSENKDNRSVSLEVTQSNTYTSRPRRSAALKCLTAIELDNKRHKELEKEERFNN